MQSAKVPVKYLRMSLKTEQGVKNYEILIILFSYNCSPHNLRSLMSALAVSYKTADWSVGAALRGF